MTLTNDMILLMKNNHGVVNNNKLPYVDPVPKFNGLVPSTDSDDGDIEIISNDEEEEKQYMPDFIDDLIIEPKKKTKKIKMKKKKKKSTKFEEFLNEHNFIGFSFYKISYESGKKKLTGMPAWKQYTENHINPNHSAFAILTGKLSGVTIIDCDTQESYEKITTDFPSLKNTFTVKTYKGYHVYTLYDSSIKGNTNSFLSYPDIDIRNDGNIVIAPPTSYDIDETTKARYKLFIQESYCSFPEVLKKDLKQFNVKVKEEKKVKEKLKPIKLNEFGGKVNDKFIEACADLIDIRYIDNYSDWIKIVWSLASVEKKDLARTISKKSKKYDYDGSEKIYNEANGTIKIGTYFHYAKISKPRLFIQVFKDNNEEIVNPFYEEMKEEFEKKNGRINNPFCYYTINSDGNIAFFNDLKFTKYHNTLKYYCPFNEKMVKFIYKWMEDENKKSWDKMCFLPNNTDPNIFNTFDGFLGEKMEDSQADLTLLFELINSLTGKDDKCFEWFLDYLCHIVGRPEEKPDIAILFYSSKEGIGKNMFIEWFGTKVLGSKYISVNNSIKKMCAQFSLAFYNTLMCIVEETDGKDGKTFKEVIKSNITCSDHNIEKKGQDIFTQKSHVRMFFLTNNRNSLQFGEGDRRFAVFEGDCSNANNSDYFSNMYSYLHTEETINSFYHFLKRRYDEKKITKGILKTNRPITELYQEMKNVDVTWRFVENFFNENDNETIDLTTNNFYERYKEYMQNYYSNYTINNIVWFSRKISLIGFEKKTNLTRKKLNGYKLDYNLFQNYLTDNKIVLT